MSEITFFEAKPSEMLAMPGIDEALAAYADECAIKALGPTNPDRGLYEAYDRAGVVRGVAATVDGRLVGGVVVLFNRMAHYSKVFACVESMFLHPSYRKGTTGLRLLKEAKRIAQEEGAHGLFISAPVGSQLERLMRAKRVPQTNSVFFEAV